VTAALLDVEDVILADPGFGDPSAADRPCPLPRSTPPVGPRQRRLHLPSSLLDVKRSTTPVLAANYSYDQGKWICLRSNFQLGWHPDRRRAYKRIMRNIRMIVKNSECPVRNQTPLIRSPAASRTGPCQPAAVAGPTDRPKPKRADARWKSGKRLRLRWPLFGYST
jgi:hypothetical protein